MLITVVTVSWNAAASIDATCASVDEQTHADVEHVVIDGQSTDGTLEVLAARPSPRRRVMSERDAGLYDAMNKGIAQARGEIVVFLNADDRYSSPEVLAEVHRIFVESDADAVYADIDMVVQEAPKRIQRRWRSGQYARWKALLGWQIPHPGLFVRREVLHRIGPFDAKLRIAADYDLMLRLLKHEKLRLHYLQMTVVQMALGGLSSSGLKSSWLGYRESAQVLCRHIGPAGYLVAIAKPIWKLPQWFRGRAANASPRQRRPREDADAQ